MTESNMPSRINMKNKTTPTKRLASDDERRLN